MRHNPEINYKDAIAMGFLMELLKQAQIDALSEEQELAISKRAYRLAEAMYKERELDEHNPTPNDLPISPSRQLP